MTKLIPRAFAIVVLLLLAVPAAAQAASSERTFDYTVVSIAQRYEWTEIGRGYPEKCRPWIKSRGIMESAVASHGGSLTLAEYYPGRLGGSNPLVTRGQVERVLVDRAHSVPETAECTPCDRGEYGACQEARPDLTIFDPCGPKATRVDTAMLANGRSLTLDVNVSWEDVLTRCPEVEPGVNAGPDRPNFGPLRMRDGVRKLMSLRVGGRETFQIAQKRGACSMLGRKGSHECTISKGKIVFRRTS